MDRDMYCRKCAYDLRGLPGNRCPECGTAFDPKNSATYLMKPRRRLKRMLPVSAMYGIVAVATFVYWLIIGESGFPGWPEVSWMDRLGLGAWQLTGPIAWIDPPRGAGFGWAWAVFGGVWIAWLAMVCGTRLRRLPLIVHFVACAGWTFVGHLRVSLVIT